MWKLEQGATLGNLFGWVVTCTRKVAAQKGREMKRNKSTARFWVVLASVNVLALSYPVGLLHRADDVDTTLFAALALIGFVFALAVVDTISIVLADVFGSGKRRRTRRTLSAGIMRL